MSDINPKVVALVERELKKNPELRSAELKVRAAKIDKAAASLSARQFHGRYALQARRKLFSGSARSKPKKKTSSKSSPPRAQREVGPALALLSDTFDDKKAALHDAIDRAFARSIQTDSVNEVNKLLLTLDRQTKVFESI